MNIDSGRIETNHNEEFRNLYPSPIIIRVMTSRKTNWSGHVARMGGVRNAHSILVGKPERKGLVGKPFTKVKFVLKK
jgi:hypothetical protein